MKNHTRPPIESLACVESGCDLYGQAGQGNLTVRKVYGKDRTRYLRCACCRQEFSERKGTVLWNTKVSEARAVAVAERLSEGCSQESTDRPVAVDISVVQRLNGVIGKHGRLFHEEQVKIARHVCVWHSPRTKKYQQAPPAMAAGLTDHIFSFRELLLTPVYPADHRR